MANVAFTQEHKLRDAITFVMGKSGEINELKSFAAEFGYPMIAKPVEGFVSQGVFLVRNWQQAENLDEFEIFGFGRDECTKRNIHLANNQMG